MQNLKPRPNNNLIFGSGNVGWFLLCQEHGSCFFLYWIIKIKLIILLNSHLLLSLTRLLLSNFATRTFHHFFCCYLFLFLVDPFLSTSTEVVFSLSNVGHSQILVLFLTVHIYLLSQPLLSFWHYIIVHHWVFLRLFFLQFPHLFLFDREGLVVPREIFF